MLNHLEANRSKSYTSIHVHNTWNKSHARMV